MLHMVGEMQQYVIYLGFGGKVFTGVSAETQMDVGQSTSLPLERVLTLIDVVFKNLFNTI